MRTFEWNRCALSSGIDALFQRNAQYLRDQRQRQRIEGCHHDFDLGHVGSVILAVSAQKQPSRIGIYRDGGRVQAHDFGGQLVNGQGAPVEIDLQGFPVLVIAKGVQEIGQTIIGAIGLLQRLFQQGLERLCSGLCPPAHLVHAMIGF